MGIGLRVRSLGSRYSQRFGRDLQSRVQSLLDEGDDEPLHWQLWRESRHLQHSNPRASLVLGVVAAEVGLKSGIARFVPAAESLLENLPSPSIAKLMTKVWPSLRGSSPLVSPGEIPKEIRNPIVKAAETRNQVVHLGNAGPDDFVLAESLNAVEELLHLIDYHCGYRWAEGHMGAEAVGAANKAGSG